MVIGRLVLILLLNLLAYAILTRLWPAVASGWRRWTFVAGVALSFLAWALPIVLGLGLHGNIPVIGTPLKVFSAAWSVAVLICVVFSIPFMVLRFWRMRRAA